MGLFQRNSSPLFFISACLAISPAINVRGSHYNFVEKKKIGFGGCQFIFMWMTCITDRLLSRVSSIRGPGEKDTFSGARNPVRSEDTLVLKSD